VDIILREHRCEKCNKLLLKAAITDGVVEIKCRNCKTMNLIKTPECNLCSNPKPKGPESKYENKYDSA
jgi:phage FluMu protein Com